MMGSDPTTRQRVAATIVAIAVFVLYNFYFLQSAGINLEKSPLVAIRSMSNGRYLALSAEDGFLRDSSNSSKNPSTHFKMLRVDHETVRTLRALKIRSEAAASKPPHGTRKVVTRSGCACTGFKSEHGFGAYCHPWEEMWQDEWCYVDENCHGRTVKEGSFKRRFEACTDAYPPWPPPPPPSPSPNPPPPTANSPPPPSIAPKSKPKKNWFGRRLLFDAAASPLDTEQISDDVNGLEFAPYSFGRRLGATSPSLRPNITRKTFNQLSKKSKRSVLHELEEVMLLKRLRRPSTQFVAFVCPESHQMLTVLAPPARDAIKVHATFTSLSYDAIFAILPSGNIMSLGTNALLNLCDPSDKTSPGSVVCTGRKKKAGEIHYKLLHTSIPTSEWAVDFL